MFKEIFEFVCDHALVEVKKKKKPTSHKTFFLLCAFVVVFPTAPKKKLLRDEWNLFYGFYGGCTCNRIYSDTLC